ncbi:MAG: histidinol dehydrogenase, partial [Gemmatimonadales bacterium]
MRRLRPEQVPARRSAVNVETLARAGAIVDDVRARGQAALLEHAARLGDWNQGEPWLLDQAALGRAFEAQSVEVRALLERTATRIRRFAEFQRDNLRTGSLPIEGGEAGFTLVPVARAGCYAPGGRFPLPSSVLMTAVTARVAGVESVAVASPRPAPITLAAAHVAGADALLTVGGAQAIAALAFGAGPLQAVDVIVGPGNRWVTAAKHIVSGAVGVDVLAGPSELVVIADDSADASTIAADLLAQAEHDTDALPVLITTSTALANAVDREIQVQLETLSTAATARAALEQGYTVVVRDDNEAVALSNRIAPEHVQL